MASDLWRSQETSAWICALRKYKTAVFSKKTPFSAVDKWYLVDLPASIRARGSQASMSRDDLVKLVEWKLARGKWRPRLLDYAKQQEEAVLKDVTELAFKSLLGDGVTSIAAIREAVSQLTQLKGVGPATASAAVATVCHHAPFMSDEALEAVMSKREYTLPAYMRLVEALQQKSKELNAVASKDAPLLAAGVVEGGLAASSGPDMTQVDDCYIAEAGWNGTWTAVWVERALWAAAVAPSSSEKVPTERVLPTKRALVANITSKPDANKRKRKK
ncbi:hypothetical protein CEUSTIGMA_g2503.t1 [Chlamydomonas eustigma]|uniref:Uncharacterized protein n=1 Tax=Chlamydomonas eustigma TaxID=1157962 RepID=A0A250WWH9_9CHLO|nr:hypothetical protein CEUSTIGMA_g2503.t1 [Chlamydomonas eustigma]|eukprot:GAX75059.1 hypothetical protein CEUSTIGMA_g2503.t1 [Chlamydomonas eustigma]